MTAVESEGGQEEEGNEEESSGQERAVGLKTHKSGGAGGVGGEEKLGCPEKDEGSKRRRRIGVRGVPVEGEQEEGGEVTMALTQYDLIMQQLIAHDHNDPTASLPFFLAWVILHFPGSLKMIFHKLNSFPDIFGTIWLVSFLYLLLRTIAHTLGTFWRLQCGVFQPATI